MWLKSVPEYTVIFCRLLLVRNLIEQLFFTLVTSISAEGNIKGYQISASLLTLLPLPVSYFLFAIGFPPYSLYIVFIVYSLFASSLILYFANKNCELSIHLFLKKVILHSVGSFVLVFVLSAMPLLVLNESILRLFIVIGISSLSFIIIVWYVGFSTEERMIIRQPIKVLFNKLKFRYVQ